MCLFNMISKIVEVLNVGIKNLFGPVMNKKVTAQTAPIANGNFVLYSFHWFTTTIRKKAVAEKSIPVKSTSR